MGNNTVVGCVSLPGTEMFCAHRHCTSSAVSPLPYLCSDGSAALAGTGVQVEVKQDAWVSDLQVWVCIDPSFQALKTSKYDKNVPMGEHRDRVRGENGSYPHASADVSRFT